MSGDLGTKHANLALFYLEHFPIGTGLYHPSKFDNWGYHLPDEFQEYRLRLPRAPKNAEQASHLQERHKLKRKINLGGASDVLDQIEKFQIFVQGNDRWETIAMMEATIDVNKTLAYQINRATATKVKRVRRLIQANKFNELSIVSQSTLNNCHNNLEAMRKVIVATYTSMQEMVDQAIASAKAEVATRKRNGEDVSELEFLLYDPSYKQLTTTTFPRVKRHKPKLRLVG